MDFRFFDNYPSKRMRFLRSHDTLSLFLHDIMTCMHIPKKYNEIHGGRTNLTIRKHAKILTTPLTNLGQKLSILPIQSISLDFRRTVNRYCVIGLWYNIAAYPRYLFPIVWFYIISVKLFSGSLMISNLHADV